MRWVLNFVWAHLQLQSDVRKVTSVFLAPVLDVIEGILSVPNTCVSRHMDMNIWIAGILWTASRRMLLHDLEVEARERSIFLCRNSVCCFFSHLEVTSPNVGFFSQDNSGKAIGCSCVLLRRNGVAVRTKPSGAHAFSEETELRPYECMVSASEGEEPRCQGGWLAAHPFHFDKDPLACVFFFSSRGARQQCHCLLRFAKDVDTVCRILVSQHRQ